MATNYRISLQAILDKASLKKVENEISNSKIKIKVDFATGDVSKYQTKLDNLLKKFQDSMGNIKLDPYIAKYNNLLSKIKPGLDKKSLADIHTQLNSLLNQMTQKLNKHEMKVKIKVDETSVKNFKARISEILNSLRPSQTKEGLTEGEKLTLNSDSYKQQYQQVLALKNHYTGAAGQASELKKAVKDLDKEFTSTSSTYDNQIEKVDELKIKYQEAFDNNPELEKTAQGVKDIAANIVNGTANTNDFKLGFAGLAKEAKNTQAQTTALERIFNNVFSYFSAYRVVSYFWQVFKNGVKQSIDYVVKMDATMSEFRYVTGMSKDQVDDLRTSFSELGQQVGATTEEIASASLEYVRQGKSIQESMKLATESIKLSKLAGIESSQATEYLTSAINGYKKSGIEANEVVDKLIAV